MKQLAFLMLIVCSAKLTAQTITLQPYTSGYNWLIYATHANDDNMYVVQQNGYIYLAIDGVKQEPAFLDVTNLTAPSGERGLLGLAFHPNYAENGYFYINYTQTSSGDTRISRFTRDANNPALADPNSELELLAIEQPYSNHNGGCIQFGKDGYLYIAMGDGGSAGDPQNLSQNPLSLLGKMLRIDVNTTDGSPYSIPSDNPFVNSTDTLAEIWTLGWRNAWRFSFDQLTGDTWAGDVGQNVWEEVNFEPYGVAGGRNYGWRCYEADASYNSSGCGEAEDYVAPVFKYNHTSANGCSITGGYVYRGALYNSLYGKYLCADYCSGRVWAVWPDGNGGYNDEVVGDFDPYEISSFAEDRLGELYLVNYGTHFVNHIVVEQDAPVAQIVNGADTLRVCGTNEAPILSLQAVYNPDLSYQWFENGVALTDQTTATLEIYPIASGTYKVQVTAPNGLTSTSDEVYFIPVFMPNIVILTGETAPCKLNQAIYQTDAYPGVEYVWTVNGGSIVSGQGTSNLLVEWGPEGTGQVNLTVNCY